MEYNKLIIQPRLICRENSPYSVYVFGMADFAKKANLSCSYHLYVALLKNSRDHFPADVRPGPKQIRNLRIGKEDRAIIEQIIGEEKSVGLLSPPADIYEGVDTTWYFVPPMPDGYRLKSYMPIPFEEEDIVLQIARYDSVFSPAGFTGKDPGLIVYAMRLMDKLAVEERKAYKDVDHHIANYASLGRLIDNWLDGHLYIGDLEAFLKKDDFVPAGRNEAFECMSEVNLYTNDLCVVLKDGPELDVPIAEEFHPVWIRIQDCYVAEGSGSFRYSFRNLHHLAAWLVRRITGKAMDGFERKNLFLMKKDVVREYLIDYMKGRKFPVDEDTDVGFIDLIYGDETDRDEIDLPYDALIRCRTTGELLQFDEEMLIARLKNQGARSLMGRGEIARVELDYDPETLDIKDLDIIYAG